MKLQFVAFAGHCCQSRGIGLPRMRFGVSFSRHNPTSSPAASWCRQALNEDEYTLSRRISAPTLPGWLQASATRTMRRLSALEKRRRRACATTSELTLGEPGAIYLCGRRNIVLFFSLHTYLVTH